MILRGPTQIYQSDSRIALRVTFAFRNELTRYTNYAKQALRMRRENKEFRDPFWYPHHHPSPTPTTGSQVPPWEHISLAEGRSSFPRDKTQIIETSDQPLSAHTKLLLLIQNGMLQILYSMNIYSLQKCLPNH